MNGPFSTFQQLKDHLVGLLAIEGDFQEEIDRINSATDVDLLVRRIIENVGTTPEDAFAWFVEAVVEDKYFQWGRPPLGFYQEKK